MLKKVLILLAALMLGSCVVPMAPMAPMEPQAPYGLSYAPPLAVVPGTYIYAAPDTPGLFFYQGYWYRHYGDRWYMATRYDSDRWSYMRDNDVPQGIYYLPQDYRSRLGDRDRIRTDDVQHNWRQWEQERRWGREKWWRDQRDMGGAPAPGYQQEPPQLPQLTIMSPSLVVIPGTYIYAEPDMEGLFFYQGYWYRQQDNRWYRAQRYDTDRWSYLRDNDVPAELHGIPHDYSKRIEGHKRIRNEDAIRNWRQWEQERRWERDPSWRGERQDKGGQQDKGKPAPYVKPEQREQRKPSPYVQPEQREQGKPSPYVKPEQREQGKPSPYVKPEQREQGKPSPYVKPEQREQHDQHETGRPVQGTPAINGQQEKGLQNKDKAKAKEDKAKEDKAKAKAKAKQKAREKEKAKAQEKDKDKEKAQPQPAAPAVQPRQ